MSLWWKQDRSNSVFILHEAQRRKTCFVTSQCIVSKFRGTYRHKIGSFQQPLNILIMKLTPFSMILIDNMKYLAQCLLCSKNQITGTLKTFKLILPTAVIMMTIVIVTIVLQTDFLQPLLLGKEVTLKYV